jgi:tRNA threonylcarbamoyl adenosine modification protein (Sua5/YciO/YrdC/YwlC family)
MSQFIEIHPVNPQPRLLQQAVDILHNGGVIVYPTDSAYALGCRLGDKQAIDRIRQIRGIDTRHYLTLVCRDLSEVATYARVDNKAFRLLKAHTPGPYTFILPATKEVPRYFQRKTRQDIGLRVPDNQIVQDLLQLYDQAIASTTLILPEQTEPLYEPEQIFEQLAHQVDLVIDGGYCGVEPTSIIDLCDDQPSIIRQGKGDTSSI